MSVLLMYLPDGRLTDDQLERVDTAAGDLRVEVTVDHSEIESLLDEIEVVAGSFPPDLLPRVPNLRWMQEWSAGVDWLLDEPAAAELDFVLTNASGVHAIPISEQIVGYLLAFARWLPGAVRAQDRREWSMPDASDVFELAGTTMLLVGVGAIGERTAMIASALGMRVIGVRRTEGDVPGVDAMHGPDELLDLLPDADVVVLTVPLSRATERMIGEAELRAMRSSAHLINIGRGSVVDEEALIRALREGRIAGAGLDVFVDEPLPETSPLWEMHNVLLTAHYSGLTPEYDARALAILLDNLERYRAGESLTNVVDKQAGY